MSDIYIRPAKPEELRPVTQLRLDAFGITGTAEAFFPDPASREADFTAWRFMHAGDTFFDTGRHAIVAVARYEDGTEELAGTAEWIAPGGAEPDATPEQVAAKRAEWRKKWPSSINYDAMAEFQDGVGEAVKASLQKAGLPEGADKTMWDLNSLAVSAKYQRRGIGQKLVEWGINRAREENKNILILGNPTGSPLYRKMGFEEIGELPIFSGRPYGRVDSVFIMRLQN